MSKKKQLTVDQLEIKIEELNTKRKELFEQRDPIDKQLVLTYNRIKKLENERDELILATSATPSWPFLLEETGTSSGIRHEAAEKEFAKIGLQISGYHPTINQRGLEIKIGFLNTNDVDSVLVGLETITPFLKPINNVYLFGIFEHTLAENGVYNLILSTVGEKCKITKTTHGHESDVMKFNTWRKALTYVSKVLWYGGYPSGKNDNDNEEDEED